MKIGLIANPTSPSSFYRAYGVLPYLARQHGCELMIGDDWDWTKVVMCDAVFAHCPSTDDHLKLAYLCRDTRTPFIVDYDDDVFHVHMSNAGFSYLAQPDVRDNIRQIISMADLVTVSTAQLQTQFSALTQKIKVVSNAWNHYMFEFRSKGVLGHDYIQPGPGSIVTWRGGPAHLHDQEEFLPAIGRVSKRHPDSAFIMFGIPHWDLWQHMGKNAKLHLWNQDVVSYLKTYNGLRPSIHIVPMVETPFNLAKSNCAWIEATVAGAMTIAPAWPEWQLPGVLTYRDQSDFEEVFESAMAMDFGQRNSFIHESRSWIHEHLRLEDANLQRLNLIEMLATKERTTR